MRHERSYLQKNRVSNQLGRAGARDATSSENGGQAGIGEYPGLDFSNISQFN